MFESAVYETEAAPPMTMTLEPSDAAFVPPPDAGGWSDAP
jgi:hypothetical protein